MNKSSLKKEGKKWVQDGIITDKQLYHMLARYVRHDQSYILILLAVLLISIGLLIFIFSDWAQVPHVSRIIIMTISMILFYWFGHRYYMKSSMSSKTNEHKRLDKPSHVYGISFIILGYMFFGATLLLIINMYNVQLFSVWPFVLWSIVGLLLYAIHQHPIFFALGVVINLFAQIYSGIVFSTFNIWIFAILFVGYFHYAYHRANTLLSYFFAIALSIQVFIFTAVDIEQYYWYMFFVFLLYALGEFIPTPSLKSALTNISIMSIFFFKMYESFLIQESYLSDDIIIQPMFFVVLGILWLFIAVYKWIQKRGVEWIDLILFIPFFFLPDAYLFIIISMFLYSVYWLIIGFQRQMDTKVRIGIATFIFSTFTVYIQYAWETLNKSLFFLIGGILLFVLSFILERKRRTNEQDKGDNVL